MERKRSGRRYYSKRKKTWTQQCKDYLRQFIAFLFSNIGIICLVVGYTIAGAFMFIVIEGKSDNAGAMQRVAANRSDTVARIWDLTCCTEYREDEWHREVQAHLRYFQSHVIEAFRNFSYEGAIKDNRWSFSGSFLYSLSVITTIGGFFFFLFFFTRIFAPSSPRVGQTVLSEKENATKTYART